MLRKNFALFDGLHSGDGPKRQHSIDLKRNLFLGVVLAVIFLHQHPVRHPVAYLQQCVQPKHLLKLHTVNGQSLLCIDPHASEERHTCVARNTMSVISMTSSHLHNKIALRVRTVFCAYELSD